MLLFAYLYFLLCLPFLTISDLSARPLDYLLQNYAFRSFIHPKTGVPVNGTAPLNLTGIEISALRLRSGSFRRKGFENFKEFHIPKGVFEQPYVERLVLVYQNLHNWSSLYYPLPGYTYLAPVLGLLVYNASDLSGQNVAELGIRAMDEPIRMEFMNVELGFSGIGALPKCVYFGLDGSVEFENVVGGNVCLTTRQGHFSIVVEFTTPPSPAPREVRELGSGGGGKVGMVVLVVVVVGGVMVVVGLCLVVVWMVKWWRRRKMRRMEEEAESGSPLRMASVGYGRALVATETRTRPLLENDYVPRV